MTFDKETMNKNMIPPIIAAAITMVVHFATMSHWHMWAEPLLIIFFTIWSFQVSIMNKWKFNRLGLLPLLIGIFCIILGLQSLFTALSSLMSGDEWAPTIVLIGTVIKGLSPSIDAFALGSGLSLFLFAFSACALSCRRQIKE